MSLTPLQHRKGSYSLYIILLVLVVGLMFMLRQCSAKKIGPRPENLAGGDTVNVAIEISPMGISMEGDSLGGVYYNRLQEIFNAHGRPVRFHAFTQLNDALEGLKEGKYNLVVADIPATAELKGEYLFVDPLGVDKQVLIQRLDSLTGDSVAIKSQIQLGGKTVHVPKGSPFIPRLENLSREIGDTIMVVEDPEYSSEQMVIMVSLGELPNVVVSKGVADPLLEKYSNIDASVGISFNQFQSWALAPRDSVLRDSLNAWLKSY